MNRNDPEVFRKAGIDFVNSFGELRKQVESGTSYRHQFLVLDNRNNQINWEWLNKYVNCLPYRILVIGDVPNTTSGSLKQTIVTVEWNEIEQCLTNLDELKDFLWRKWVQHWWRSFTLCVRWTNNTTIAENFLHQGEDPAKPCYLVYDHQSYPDRERNDNLFQSAAFHECFSAGTPMAQLLQSTDGWVRWRVKEAAAISVGILDERIFLEKDENARKGTAKYSIDGNKKIGNAWHKRRVQILDYQEAINDFGNFVRTLGSELQEMKAGIFDFFVIHQGIIDEVEKRNSSVFEDDWEALKKLTRWIVIDTGRGRPGQAMGGDCLRWVEYSNLAEFMVRRAAIKFDLAQLLFALQAEFPKAGGS